MEQDQLNTLVQLSSSNMNSLDSQAKIESLKHKIAAKKEQVRGVVANFKSMGSQLSQIKADFEKEKSSSMKKLQDLKAIDEDTTLSKLFEAQSLKMRSQLVQQTKSH